MSDKYYQKYGPMNRRRQEGQFDYDPPPEREPQEPRRPSRRQPPQRRRSSLTGILVFLIVVAGVALALPYATNVLASEEAVQGVSIQGQAVGGMDRAAIKELLDQRYETFQRAPFTLTFEGKTWTPTLEQLGAKLDLAGTADEAVLATRRGGPIERSEDLYALWQQGLDIAPHVVVDTPTLQTYLNGIAREIEQPPRDAALSVAEGKVIPTAAAPGRQLLADATTADILDALQSLAPQTVTVRTRTLTPVLDNNGITQAAADAQSLLASPLTLKQGDRNWTWDAPKIAELLVTTRTNGQMHIGVDHGRLEHAVEKLAQLVDSGSAEPRVAFRNNKLAITDPGKTGWQLEQPAAVDAISATLRLPQRTLDLPVKQLTPQVRPETLATLGINELVGEGKTSFAGSAPYRITNIKAGAQRMNGVLIAPGEEFSFNTQLGEVDESNGFVQGYAVIGNRTQLEWGGGVCQDSTTLFRAAFWAGLPITERHAHPFYISWYDDYSFPGGGSGPGMDATIFTGVQDLKFVNDTGHWMLMEAVVDEGGQVLTMRLYGTKPNRTVELRGPQIDNVVPPPSDPVYLTDDTIPSGTVKQTDTARKGMDIAVYRVITENGKEQQPEPFYTRFKAWPDVFVRGTG